MRRISSNSESGAILAIVIILMLALTITGIAFLNAGVMEYRLAKREDYKNKAFYIAEGGLDRTIWNLREHFKSGIGPLWPDGGNGTWPTGFINEVPVGKPDNYWGLKYGQYDNLGEDEYETDLGDGSYEVKLYYEGEEKIRIKSTGTVENVSRTVQIILTKGYFYPWDTAIFAGQAAAGGSLINGNVRVAGSVLVLAEHLSEEDPVVELMDWTGDAGIRNNYENMDINLAEVTPGTGIRRIPECPEVDYDGEWLESLEATLRVRRGKVRVGGNVLIGEENFPSPGVKGTLDGVYVDGGFDIRGNAAVNSDNPLDTKYDLEDMISFPSLLRNHPDYAIPRIDYLEDPLNSLSLAGITEISSNVPSFWAKVVGGVTEFHWGSVPGLWPPSGDNYIAWDQGKLSIGGIIYVEQDSLKLGERGKTIEYDGTGTIVVARRGHWDPVRPEYESIVGEIRVHGDFLVAEGEYSEGGLGGFPNNVLGLVTGDLHIAGPGEPHLVATGAFFAENVIKSDLQNEIAGTFISGRFDIETGVPRLYQVRELKDNLPPGIPGGVPQEIPVFKDWSES